MNIILKCRLIRVKISVYEIIVWEVLYYTSIFTYLYNIGTYIDNYDETNQMEIIYHDAFSNV